MCSIQSTYIQHWVYIGINETIQAGIIPYSVVTKLQWFESPRPNRNSASQGNFDKIWISLVKWGVV